MNHLVDRRVTAAIILAGGRSRRFGPENKLMHMFEGAPLIMQTLRTVSEVGFGQVVIVTGEYQLDNAITSAFPSFNQVHNDRAEEGLSSSIRVGVSALREDVQAAFIVLGDMPKVVLDTYISLMEARASRSNVDAYVPFCNERPGNPVLFNRSAFENLAMLTGDKGARSLLASERLSSLQVAVEDEGIHFDVDVR